MSSKKEEAPHAGSSLLAYVRALDEKRRWTEVHEWRVWSDVELRRRDLIGDHQKTMARLLLARPFQIVASLDDRRRAQELCVRLPQVGPNPDDVLDELFSVLSIFTRGRFQVGSRVTAYCEPIRPKRARRNAANSMYRTVVSRLPVALHVAGPWPPINVEDAYVFDFDESIFRRWLRTLAREHSPGEDFVRAARLYASGLELMRVRPDVAYLLFVSSVETMASRVFERWLPSAAEQRQASVHGAVSKAARHAGLSVTRARTVAGAAVKHERWIGRKFVKYLEEGVGKDVVLHPKLIPGMPKPEDHKTVFQSIYAARSHLVHAGKPLPATAHHMLGDRVPWEVVRAEFSRAGGSYGKGDVPSVGWFAHAAAIAHARMIQRALRVRECPVRPHDATDDQFVLDGDAARRRVNAPMEPKPYPPPRADD